MTESRKTSRAPLRARAAFSLIEVVLAVGIAALALVALVGMLPAGMDSLRVSGNRMATARILAAITHDLQMRDFQTLQQQQSGELEYQFDAAGDPMAKGEDSAGAIGLRAKVELLAPTTAGLLPGAAAANPFALRARVRISDKPVKDALDEGRGAWERTIIVTRMEKVAP